MLTGCSRWPSPVRVECTTHPAEPGWVGVHLPGSFHGVARGGEGGHALLDHLLYLHYLAVHHLHACGLLRDVCANAPLAHDGVHGSSHVHPQATLATAPRALARRRHWRGPHARSSSHATAQKAGEESAHAPGTHEPRG